MGLQAVQNNYFDKFIGNKFKYTDDHGNYMGCLLPFYLLYPEAYRFKPFDFTNKSIKRILENHCKVVKTNYEFGDLFIFKHRGLFHAALYIDSGKFVHCGNKQSIKYIHKSLVRFNSLIGVYRWK